MGAPSVGAPGVGAPSVVGAAAAEVAGVAPASIGAGAGAAGSAATTVIALAGPLAVEALIAVDSLVEVVELSSGSVCLQL